MAFSPASPSSRPCSRSYAPTLPASFSASPNPSSSPWHHSSQRATSSWRTCPASASRCWPRPSPARLGCGFHPIPFTPALLPSDLLGTSIYQQSPASFVFQPGPIFTQVVLADEINRATPRTQSALLEAMSDRQVSLDGKTHPLGPPFFVLATQNPYEFEGTYPLPESQLDRFLIRLKLGYPDREAERLILSGHREGEPVEKLTPVLAGDEVVGLQHAVREVKFADELSDYLLDVVEATRQHADVQLGASTRAALSLYRAAQARALLAGRTYAVPDDVKRLAPVVLAHRLLLRRAR